MRTTVYGRVRQLGGISYQRNHRGAIEAATAIDHISTRLPDDGIIVDANHTGRRVGLLTYAELDENNLNAVCLIDDDWPLAAAEHGIPLYFSGAYATADRDDESSACVISDAELVGLSLTLDPANISASPVGVLSGSVFDPQARQYQGWRSSPLLVRAVAHVEPLATVATSVVDRRYGDPVQTTDDAWLAGGELVVRDQRPPGGLRYWPATRGSVLRVS